MIDGLIAGRLIGDPVLENSLQVNTKENFRLTFNNVVNEVVQEMIVGGAGAAVALAQPLVEATVYRPVGKV